MREFILIAALNAFENRCNCSQFYHVCVAFRGTKILAMGYNCCCRSLKQYGDAKSMHAEIDTLRRLKSNQRSKPFDILVIRINKTKTSLLDSQPCIRCENWMKNYPVRRIYFSVKTDGEGMIKYIEKKQFIKSFKMKNSYRPISCKAASGLRIPICLSRAS